ncbi:unnamed protein product [Rangifer tarandus platyrhynchus]|uniref:Uncharacterized protein n=2 Tax=Rangifer tarandus platyrhynchus TaxID=3082113 RepID=A0ACB0E161_RANTA|nr:unnamed protein product [Rangifer tarandus platyrhynchus]CAI9694337.1 unnamed protein product [Rangifer tarandus platyrhynchus]
MKRALGARTPPRGGRPALHGFGVWGLGLRSSKAALAERAEGRRGIVSHQMVYRALGTREERDYRPYCPAYSCAPGETIPPAARALGSRSEDGGRALGSRTGGRAADRKCEG